MKYSHCLQGHHIPVGPTPYIQMLRVFVPTAHFSALLKVPKALNFTPSLLQTSAAASSLHLPLLTDRFSEHLTLGPRPLPPCLLIPKTWLYQLLFPPDPPFHHPAPS